MKPRLGAASAVLALLAAAASLAADTAKPARASGPTPLKAAGAPLSPPRRLDLVASESTLGALLQAPAPAPSLVITDDPAPPLAPAPIVPYWSLPAAPAAAPAAGAGPDLARLFDGAYRLGSFIEPRRDLSRSVVLQEKAAVVKKEVERASAALEESVSLGAWCGVDTRLDDSACGDAAPKLAVLLRSRGVPMTLVESEVHFYLLLELPEGQIVVDPTIRQFFGGRRAPGDIPRTFVGTVDELGALFRRHRAANTIGRGVDGIYFNGTHARLSRSLELEQQVRAGGKPEHDPLRAYLGLPRLFRSDGPPR